MYIARYQRVVVGKAYKVLLINNVIYRRYSVFFNDSFTQLT